MEIPFQNIGSYIMKNYLLYTPKGIIAIDTGYPGGAQRFIRQFTKHHPLSELAYIFLTHHHDDHAGFLNDLLQVTDATLILHHTAIPHLQNGQSYDPPQGGYSSWPASLFGAVKTEFRFPPVQLPNHTITLYSESQQPFEELGLPIRIVFLPGHTQDSIGLLLTHTGQLFCGDAAMNAIISIARHTIWIDNAEQFALSWDKMLSLNPTRIYPSHGTPFSPRDLARHRNYLSGRKLIRPKGDN